MAFNTGRRVYLLADLASTRPHLVVLEPGETLLVPRHWWHLVENLETSISVNTWIELVGVRPGLVYVYLLLNYACESYWFASSLSTFCILIPRCYHRQVLPPAAV